MDTWAKKMEAMHPDGLVEIPDANVFFRNKKLFEDKGFSLEIFDKLFPIIEQQMFSILALFTCAKSVPIGGTICEIGSGRGGSISTIGLANPSANLINIDRFSSYDEETHTGTNYDYPGFTYSGFLKNIEPFNLKLKTIRKWSDDAVNDIEDKSLDMIFIDGNHGYEYCKRDIINYAPKLKEKGIMCGHDYHPRFPGVIKAVREMLANRYFVVENSSVWVRKDKWME